MLTIKRVPTVVSNYQEDSVEQPEAIGCGQNCLGRCCLQVSKLPLYEYKEDDDDEPVESRNVISSENQPPMSFLNNLLLGQWEDRMSRGLFRYDVTACESKVIPGKHGFVAQLNEGRHLKKRPTEFRVDQVLQPFDENKFNFKKIAQDEVLFRFEPSSDDGSPFFSSLAEEFDSVSPTVVAINVSPIEYGHVLLIPHVLDCKSQRIDNESFFVALRFAKEAADPFFRLGYNSLGAFATINHLHFQAYYLSVPFAVEKAPTQSIMTGNELHKSGVIISQLLNYPVRGLVFEGGRTMRDLSDVVANACIRLQNYNIPFNVLIADCGRKIFFFPQCYAEKQALGEVSQELLDTQVNPAVWEISGHMVLKRKKDYEDASEDYAWRLLAEVSMSETRFHEVKALILDDATTCHKVHLEQIMTELEEMVDRSHANNVALNCPQDCMIVR